MSHRRAPWSCRVAIGVALLLTAGVAAVDAPARAELRTATASDSQQALDQLNRLRAVAGLRSVTGSATLASGAQAHARYSLETGTVGHTQDPSDPFASTAGAQSAARSNVALRTTGASPLGPRGMVDMLQVAPFHGLLHLQPRLASSGVGYARADDREALVVDVRSDNDASIEDPPYPIAFPGPGSTTTLRSYAGGEYPDPLGPCDGWTAPTGAPILVLLPDSSRTSSVVVTDPDGEQLPICWYDADRYDTADARELDLGRGILDEQNALVVLPRDPLTTGRHRVTLDLGHDGPAAWSFRVGSSLQPATGWVRQPIDPNPRFESVCPASSLPVLTFDDVAPGRHDHAIACGLRWGLLSGTSQHAFSPATPVTRGQSATMLYGLLATRGDPPVATDDVDLSDVRPDDVHGESILALAAQGIISGRSDGTFGSGEPVTRAQFVAMLSRLLEQRFDRPAPGTATSRFDDVATGSLYHPPIEHLADLGIVAGVSVDAFAPSTNVRRDHAASFLLRTAVLLAGDGHLPPPS